MSKQKYAMFCTPSYTHSVCLEYFRSVLQMLPLLAKANINSGFSVNGGDQFIAKARNLLCGNVLARPEVTDMFFLDDDVGFPPEKVVKFLMRSEDVILGAYPKKQEERDFPIEVLGDRETGALIERDGLVRLHAGPTGFMRIRRHVIEHMARVSSVMIDNGPDGTERRSPNIFHTGVGEDGRFYGEDWAFCQDIQAQGFEVWCDPDIEFTHRGNKLWKDRLSDHLDVFRNKGIAAAQELAEAEQAATEGETAAEPGTLAEAAE